MRLPADATLIVIGAQDAMGDPRPAPRAGADANAEDKIAALMSAWRAEGLPLVHIRHPVAPVSSRARQPRGHRFTLSATPLDGETVIVKGAGSAFAGTELERLLDQIGATTLLLCGALIPSLEATARDATNLGYQIFVVADACWGSEGLDHRGTGRPAEDAQAPSLALLQGEYGKVVDAGIALDAAKTAKARQRRAAERRR